MVKFNVISETSCVIGPFYNAVCRCIDRCSRLYGYILSLVEASYIINGIDPVSIGRVQISTINRTNGRYPGNALDIFLYLVIN